MNRSWGRLRPSQMPLRWRLTLWYTLAMGLLILLFSAFLYLQLRGSLLAQLDAALQVTAAQALINVDEDDGRLVFEDTGDSQGGTSAVSGDYVIRLLAADGTVDDIFSGSGQVPVFAALPAGYRTIALFGDLWRVYTQPVTSDDATGMLQIVQELEPLNETLASFLRQLMLGLTIALFLAGLGGYFLASRALRPIDQMTQTAEAISAQDLSRRIQYQGPVDEVGRLAQTFDTMLDRLQAAFERERRFSGDAAHELRTPLTALKGRIDVTLSRSRPPEVYRQTLQEMEGQVDRLIRLSSDLLFMVRFDGERLAQRLELLDLGELAKAMGEQMRPLAAAKEITLSEFISTELLIYGDMDLLIRLFLNLLDNAVKYTPAGGAVEIRATRQGHMAQVAISDSGPGIPAWHVPHLFERFYRVEDDRARQDENRQGGAGLGLAMAYDIARAHKGTLSVETAVGEGTTFTFTCPLAYP